MDMKLKCINIFLTLVLIIASSAMAREFTDEDIEQMVESAPGPEMFPQAGVLILLDKMDINVAEDMSVIADEHIVVKILQDRGKFSYGDIKRRYNRDSDSIVVIKAVTHLPDGSIREVEQKAINDITPAALANASIYSNIRQKVVSFPAIAPGVTVELKLRRYSSAPEEGEKSYVWGTDLFQDDEPISYKELSVKTPESVPVKFTYQNEGVNHSVDSLDGFISHTWWTDGANQIISEPFMPEIIKVAPRIIYTSADSWSEVGTWFSEKFYTHVQTDGEIEKMVKKLIKGVDNDAERVKALSLYVINEIRDVGERSLPLGIAGYEPHDASEVLENKYGDWRDKVVLLVSLLESAGYEAYPAFIHRSEPPLAEDYPTLKQFDAIIVNIPNVSGAPQWINPFADHCAYGFLPYGQGMKSFVVQEKSSEFIPVLDLPPEDNLTDVTFEIDLKENGDAEGRLECDLKGYFDWRARSRLKNEKPKKTEQFFSMAANSISEGGRSVEYELSELSDLTQPVKIAQKFFTPELGIKQGNMMIFYMPEVPYYFATPPVETGEAMRFYDYELDSDLLAETKASVLLPSGYKAVYIPEPISIENNYGKWTSEYSINGDKVEYTASVKIVDKSLDPDEYFEFKEAYDEFIKPKNNMILLERQ